MKFNSKIWLYLFIALVIIHLISILVPFAQVMYFTKPLLLITLAIYFFQSTKKYPGGFRNFVIAGLIFSVIGDSFLMFVNHSERGDQFFMLGLVSFLLTHILYIFAFYGIVFKIQRTGKISYWWLFLLFFYLVGLLWTLGIGVPEAMKIPVMIYSFTIAVMVASCLNLWGIIQKRDYWILAAGACLFTLSDSLIGLARFRMDLFLDFNFPFWIMLFYLAGQVLIVRAAIGILRSGKLKANLPMDN